MPELDGFATLREIGDHPDEFRAIDAIIAKAARELIVKRLKHKSLTVQDARAVRGAVGNEAFDLITDDLSAANLKSIVTKLDKHHAATKGSTPQWQRQHLRALLEGTVEPTPKSSRSKQASPPAKPPATSPPIGFKTEAMSVFRESLKRK
jgi:hypothetical protein